MNNWFGQQFKALSTATQPWGEAIKKPPKPDPFELITERLRYEPVTGQLIRNERTVESFSHCKDPERICSAWNKRSANKPLPIHVKHGRAFITIDNNKYSPSKAAWILAYKEEPEGDVRHRDGDKTNIQLRNLYLDTEEQRK